MKKYWILEVVVICFGVLLCAKVLGVSANEKTQLETFGVSTLHGLKAIYPVALIVIQREDEPVPDRIGSLTRTEIETDVVLALRRAGIRVDYGDTSNQLFIYIEAIRLDIPTTDAGLQTFYALKTSTELHQHVNLSRDPKIQTKAKTWPAEPFVVGRGIRIAPLETVGKWVKKDVAKQMEVFCNDYLAANPKDEQDNK
jgi:hypothetical protein